MRYPAVRGLRYRTEAELAEVLLEGVEQTVRVAARTNAGLDI